VKERSSFLKKRTKKLFAPLRAVLHKPGTKTNKVFLLCSIENPKIVAGRRPSHTVMPNLVRHPRLFHRIHRPCRINASIYPQMTQMGLLERHLRHLRHLRIINSALAARDVALLQSRGCRTKFGMTGWERRWLGPIFGFSTERSIASFCSQKEVLS